MAVNQTAIETSVERREREILIAKWGWQKFNQLFPDETACIKELNERASKTSSCLCCLRTGWHIAGNYIARARKIRPWFAALWLHEQGIKMASSQFADFANVSKATGASILRSVAQLAENAAESTDNIEISTPSETRNLIRLSEYKPSQKTSTVKDGSASEPVREKEPPHPKLPKHNEVEGESEDGNKDRNKDGNKSGSEVEIKTETEKLDAAALKKNKDAEVAKLKEKFFALLADGPKSFADLQEELDAPVNMASVAAVLLEIDGAVTRLPGHLFIKTATQESQRKSHKNADELSIPNSSRKSQNSNREYQNSSFESQNNVAKSIFNIVKAAIKEVVQIVIREASRIFCICKKCNGRSKEKKI